MTKKRRSKIRKSDILRNKKLLKRYPWLMPRNIWTGKIPEDYDFSYIEWFGWPQGWNKAFGTMFLKEIGAEIKKSRLIHFQVEQMKEKYGQMRCYCTGYNRKTGDIITKYEFLSENICITCGKPDVPMINNHGWISPECLDCFMRGERHYKNILKKQDKPFVPWTDEELRQKYQDAITEEADENGEYKMANQYTRRHWDSITDKPIDETFDITETANAIRERWKKRREQYAKRKMAR